MCQIGSARPKRRGSRRNLGIDPPELAHARGATAPGCPIEIPNAGGFGLSGAEAVKQAHISDRSHKFDDRIKQRTA